MKCKVFKGAIIGIITLSFLLSFSFVDAQTEAERLRDSFDKATVVKEGDLIEGKDLRQGVFRSYKIDLSRGYQLRIVGSGTSKKGYPSDFRISIYDRDGNLLSSMKDIADGEKAVEAYYYKGAVANGTDPQKNEKEAVYVVLECAVGSYHSAIDSYSFKVSVLDRTDMKKGTDAGDTTETALALDLANPKNTFSNNFLGYNKCGKSKFCSTDEEDIYSLDLKSGEDVSLSVKPTSAVELKAYLQDVNGIVIKELNLTDKSNILSTSFKSTINAPVYLRIKTGNFGSYSIEYEKKKDQIVSDTSTFSEKNSEVFGAILKSGKSWFQRYWIWLVVGIAVAAAIVFALLFLRKFRKRTVRGVILSEMMKQKHDDVICHPKSVASNKDKKIANIRNTVPRESKPPLPKQNTTNINKTALPKTDFAKDSARAIPSTSMGERKPVPPKSF